MSQDPYILANPPKRQPIFDTQTYKGSLQTKIIASENLTASAGENMGINAGDDITMGAGSDTTITAGEDLSILAKNITEQASENFESLAVNLDEHADIISKNSSKEDIELNSSGNVKSNTGDKVNLF